MKTAKLFSIYSLFTFLLLSISSCTPDPTPAAPDEYGKIMLFHAAPGAVPVDLYMDGAKSNTTSVSYGSTSGYVQAKAGTTVHKLQTKTVTGTLIDSVSLKVNKDVGYSYYAYKDNDAAGTIRIITTTDALTAPAAGKAKIRFVNLIPDVVGSAGIDVEAVAQGGVASSRNDFTNVKFKESRDFIEVTKGSYDLKVKRTGLTELIITKATPITLVEGKIYTFVAHGLSAKVNTDPQTGVVSTIANN
jgi:hypothetical protein